MSTKKKPAAKKPAVKKVEARPPGRPTSYTDAVAAEICRLMAEEGLSVRKICEREGMPSRMTVIHWLADERHAEFLRQYACAREALADYHAEATVDIADESDVVVKHEGEDVTLDLSATAVARNRLRMDARKWYASKLAPKKYGERIEQVHSGSVGLGSILNEIDGTSAGLPTGG